MKKFEKKRIKKKAFYSTCTTNSDTQRGVFNFKYGEGFNTWKKATEKFKEHEDSFTHKNACAATASENVAKRLIAATLSSQILEQQGVTAARATFAFSHPENFVASRGCYSRENGHRIQRTLILMRRDCGCFSTKNDIQQHTIFWMNRNACLF